MTAVKTARQKQAEQDATLTDEPQASEVQQPQAPQEPERSFSWMEQEAKQREEKLPFNEKVLGPEGSYHALKKIYFQIRTANEQNLDENRKLRRRLEQHAQDPSDLMTRAKNAEELSQRQARELVELRQQKDLLEKRLSRARAGGDDTSAAALAQEVAQLREEKERAAKQVSIARSFFASFHRLGELRE